MAKKRVRKITRKANAKAKTEASAPVPESAVESHAGGLTPDDLPETRAAIREALSPAHTAFGEERFADAEAICRQVLADRGGVVDVLKLLGDSLFQQDQHQAAADIYRDALAKSPQDATLLNNLGYAVEQLDCFDEAHNLYRRSLEIDPNSPVALANLGNSLRAMRQMDEALAAYEKAFTIQPGYDQARFEHGLLLLLLERYREGWPGYEVRYRLPFLKLGWVKNKWNGTPMPQGTLLLSAEQGMGDTLQTLRYLPWVRERVGKLYFFSHERLLPMLKNYPGIDHATDDADGLQVNATIAIMSLPQLFDATVNTLPAPIPYIHPAPAKVKAWAKRMKTGKLNVGINWTGNPNINYNRKRTIPIQDYAPLAKVKNVAWHSLQFGHGRDEIENAPKGMKIHDWADEQESFDDAAALIANLDLVITIDTGMAHLAGAMGKPVWVFLPYIPDWRWHLDREDSPWYPSAWLLRQPSWSDWETPIARAAEALKKRVAGKDVGAPVIIADTSTTPLMRLNLGSGYRKIEGFVNVDKIESCEPDTVFDLEEIPWPWPDNSVSEIHLTHVLEHLGQAPGAFLRIMQEIYRVCRPNANLRVVVPHPRHDDFFSDPTHVRPITPLTMRLFDARMNHAWIRMNAANTPLAIQCGVDFEVVRERYLLDPNFQKEYPNLPPEQVQRLANYSTNAIKEIQFDLMVRKPMRGPEE